MWITLVKYFSFMFDKPDFNPHFTAERQNRIAQLWITVNLIGVYFND